MPGAAPILVVGFGADRAAECRAALTAAGVGVAVLRDESEALRRVRRAATPVLVVDLMAAPTRAFRLIAAAAAERSELRILALRPDGGANLAATAMRVGAFDHVLRSAPRPVLLAAVLNARAAARSGAGARDDGLPPAGFVGDSAVMRGVHAALRRLGPALCPVAVVGESGTGKTLAARALHAGRRQGGALEMLDAAALEPEAQTEALFGPAGAVTRGGTLLVRDAGSLSLSAQSRLIRMLRGGVAGPDGPGEVAGGPRLVFALRRDPDAEVREGRLREALRRLFGAAEIRLPSLAARGEDWRAILRAGGLGDLHPEVERMLAAHPWPGNLGELIEVRRALLEAGPGAGPSALPTEVFGPRRVRRPAPRSGGEVGVGDGAGALPGPGVPLAARVAPLVGATLGEVEAALIQATLARCDGSVGRAAAMLGVTPSTLYRRGVQGRRGLAKRGASGDARAAAFSAQASGREPSGRDAPDRDAAGARPGRARGVGSSRAPAPATLRPADAPAEHEED